MNIKDSWLNRVAYDVLDEIEVEGVRVGDDLEKYLTSLEIKDALKEELIFDQDVASAISRVKNALIHKR